MLVMFTLSRIDCEDTVRVRALLEFIQRMKEKKEPILLKFSEGFFSINRAFDLGHIDTPYLTCYSTES